MLISTQVAFGVLKLRLKIFFKLKKKVVSVVYFSPFNKVLIGVLCATVFFCVADAVDDSRLVEHNV
jgi:hypothetical protein